MERRAVARPLAHRSLTATAASALRRDLEGKGAPAGAVPDAAYDAALLVTLREPDGRSSRWVLLPDRRAILWRFTGGSVLRWNRSQLHAWNCGDDACAGALVAADGRLLEPRP